MKKYKKVLSNKYYRRYLTAQVFSMLSDSLFKISLTWYLVSSTGSVKPIAIMILIGYLPQLFVGLLGSRLIDKYDRKHIMVISDIVSGIFVLLLLVAEQTSIFAFSILYPVRLVLSTMDVFYSPASMAYIPRLVEKEDLLSANTLSSMIREGMVVLGAGLSAALVSVLSLPMILLLNVLAYIFSAAMIFSIPVSGLPEKSQDESETQDTGGLRYALRYVFSNPYIYEFMILIFLSNIVFNLVYELPSAYAYLVLEGGPNTYGLLQMASSVGIIVGVAVVGILHVRNAGKLFVLSSFLVGIVLSCLGLNRSVILAVGLFFLFSFFDAFSIPCFTYLQLYVADSVKGRVFAVFDTVVLFAAPFSTLLMFFVVDAIGVGGTYLLSGALFIGIGIVALLLKTVRKADLRELYEKTGGPVDEAKDSQIK